MLGYQAIAEVCINNKRNRYESGVWETEEKAHEELEGMLEYMLPKGLHQIEEYIIRKEMNL